MWVDPVSPKHHEDEGNTWEENLGWGIRADEAGVQPLACGWVNEIHHQVGKGYSRVLGWVAFREVKQEGHSEVLWAVRVENEGSKIWGDTDKEYNQGRNKKRLIWYCASLQSRGADTPESDFWGSHQGISWFSKRYRKKEKELGFPVGRESLAAKRQYVGGTRTGEKEGREGRAKGKKCRKIRVPWRWNAVHEEMGRPEESRLRKSFQQGQGLLRDCLGLWRVGGWHNFRRRIWLNTKKEILNSKGPMGPLPPNQKRKQVP